MWEEDAETIMFRGGGGGVQMEYEQKRTLTRVGKKQTWQARFYSARAQSLDRGGVAFLQQKLKAK